MAVNNNTNALGTSMRVTARQFADSPTATRLSQQIARSNLRSAFKSDARMARIRVYARKLVSRFTTSEKMAILAEFGDPRRDSSDDAVVEALIINMKEGELAALVSDIAGDEAQLGNKVRQIRANKKRAASKFSARTFEDIYGSIKGAKNPKQIRKELSAYDKSFKVPRAVYSQFGNLKRELEGVLRDIYNRVELSGLAIRMGISLDDETTQKQIIGNIVNKVLLFVSLITGKTKGGYANAIIDDSPYKEVLQYTSYSWAAGVVGKSGAELSVMQKQAREAKARSRETFVQRDRPGKGFGAGVKKGGGSLLGLVGGGALGGLGGAGLATLLGGPVGGLLSMGATALGSLGGGALGSFLGKGTVGGLFSPEFALQRKAEANVSNQVAFKDRLDTLDTQELYDEAAKYGLKPRKDLNGLKRDIRVQIEKKRIRIANLEKEKAKASSKGRAFDKNKAAQLAVLKSDIRGVEVGDESFQGSSKIPYILFSMQTGPDLSKLKAAVPVFVVNQAAGTSQTSSQAQAASTGAGRSLLGILSRNAGREMGGNRNYAYLYSLASSNLPQHDVRLGKDGQVEAVFINGSYLKKQELMKYIDDDKDTTVETSGKASGTANEANSANATAFISDDSRSIGLSKRIKKEPVTPVYIVNKNPLDVRTRQDQAAENAAKAALEAVGINLDGLATGGTGRAAGLGRKTTHFISGDSLSKRPNPEQVSINWSDKSYSVKPIPQFADGGGQTASGQIRRMTPGERQEPMKVYAVNNSITEMVELNGKSVSLIGLVSEMNGRLGAIEGLLAIGNTNSEAIVRSTALTATSIGRISAPQSGSNTLNPFANGFPSDLNPILSGS